jgi:hypothetical protein
MQPLVANTTASDAALAAEETRLTDGGVKRLDANA